MILPIVTEPNAILHQATQPVTEFTPELVSLVKDMRETMINAEGLGLAAPQIGKNISLFVIGYDDLDEPEYSIPFQAFVNPRITWKSPKKVKMAEACLSIPDLEGDVIRPEKIRIKAKDEHGIHFELEASGMLARAIQHEVDHLHGILFTSYLPKKQLKSRKTPEYPRV